MGDYLDKIFQIVEEDIVPLEQDFLMNGFGHVLPQLNECRKKVKEQGLWTPYLSEEYGGMGLTLVEFAAVSELLGKTPLGHYCFNSQAPDIGNIELLKDHGSDQLKSEFLLPLISGEIRSCFGMTEPQRPGSNPTWMDTLAVRDGDDYVINGNKWFTSAADGSSICIVMAVTDPEAENKYERASMFVVPLDNPGFKVVRNIPVMGDVGEDYMSHGETRLTDCRIPASNIIGKEGKGFILAQERLGPGRIHHCMRAIGQAEVALELMVKRASTRVAFGKPIIKLGKNLEVVSRARIEIDACRLMVLQAAKAMDVLGNKEARIYVSAVKAMVPEKVCKIIDDAIQMHGATGTSQWTPLARMYANQRTLRFADGPDEVHHMVVGRNEVRKYDLW